jgi:hypothetical protein
MMCHHVTDVSVEPALTITAIVTSVQAADPVTEYHTRLRRSSWRGHHLS